MQFELKTENFLELNTKKSLFWNSCTFKDSGMDKTPLDISRSGCPDEHIIGQKSVINYSSGPIAQLGLILGTANRCVEPEQNNDSGAGANAGSSNDMVFVNSNPLSELVWSPQKGLCLKCADCNLSNKKGVSWGMVLSPPQSITIGQNKDMEPLPGGLDNGGSLDPSMTKQCVKEHSPIQVIKQSEDFKDGTSSDQFRGQRDVCTGNSHTSGINIESTRNIATSKNDTLPDTPIQFSASACNDHRDLALAVRDEGVKKTSVASSKFFLGRGNSASDCGLNSLKGESDSVELDMTSHPADEVTQNKCQNGVLPQDDVTLAEESLENGNIPLYQEMEKGKILSNAVADTRILNDDDCHESVESCNNGRGLILARKRPHNFDENLVVENKKMKQIHNYSHCTSAQRHGSSFMNWISNMVKGASKPDSTGTTSMDLITRPSLHDNGSDDQHLMSQERSQQPPKTGTGFGTVFKALYCSGVNLQETGISNMDQLEEGSKEPDLANKICENRSFPITCGEENMILCKENGVFPESQDMCTDTGALSSPPKVQFEIVSAVQEEHNFGAVKNENSINLSRDHGKGGQVSSSSSFENSESSPSEERETHVGFSAPDKCSTSVIDTSHPLGSQWITRFFPTVTDLMIGTPQCEQNVGEAVTGPRDIIVLPSQNCTGSVKDQSNFVDCREPSTEESSDSKDKKLQNCVDSTAVSFGLMRNKEQINQTLEPAMNTAEPSQSFTNSEAMASVFARRVDALRHIMLSEVKDNTSQATKACIFCGIGGHKLQECSEVTESELEVLLRKLGSCDGAEETPFLCIRCFEPNHWAISCSNISSKKQSHSDGSSALLDFRNFGKISHTTRSGKDMNKEKKTMSNNVVCRGTVALIVSDGKKQRLDKEFRAGTDANENINDEMILNRTDPCQQLTKKDMLGNNYYEGNSLGITSTEFILNGKQARKSSSAENVSKECQITAFSNFVNKQIPTIPRGTFEAIKKLRLSRADIFKWRRSLVSLFTLEGFFVRLRLKKWEKELGTTGYYVARINGGLREKSSGSSKAPLSVKIGGFKCLVESRFISNHDFLEDELIAWWCATLKGGGNIPSENDLEMKLRERISFEL